MSAEQPSPMRFALAGGFATAPIAASLPWFVWGNPYIALLLFLGGLAIWNALRISLRSPQRTDLR